MKLHAGAYRLSAQPQGIALCSSPGSPLDDHCMPKSEKVLGELPLKFLDSAAEIRFPQPATERDDPFVRTETNGSQFLFQLLRVSRLARAGQAAHDDESSGGVIALHGAVTTS